MPSKYGKWFPFYIVLIPIFISLSLPILLYLWAGGWFGEVSTFSPVFAYIWLGLSLFLLVGGVVAGVMVAVTWFKYHNDKEPAEGSARLWLVGLFTNELQLGLRF